MTGRRAEIPAWTIQGICNRIASLNSRAGRKWGNIGAGFMPFAV